LISADDDRNQTRRSLLLLLLVLLLSTTTSNTTTVLLLLLLLPIAHYLLHNALFQRYHKLENLAATINYTPAFFLLFVEAPLIARTSSQLIQHRFDRAGFLLKRAVKLIALAAAAAATEYCCQCYHCAAAANRVLVPPSQCTL
jgi:hypothetical protein